jgi:hypothetical protein
MQKEAGIVSVEKLAPLRQEWSDWGGEIDGKAAR